MFYSNVILTKKGPLGYVWLAATIGERSISKKYAVKARIAVLCDTIQTPDAPFALRLSAHLLLGVARVYARKSSFVLADMNSLLKALHACPSRFEANATWGTIQSSPTPRKQLREGAKRKYHFNADGVTQAENTAILRPSCNKQDMNRCKKSSRLDISEANKAFDSPVIDSGVMFLSPRFGSHYSDGDDAKYPVDISAAMEMAFPNEVPLQTYSLTDNDQIKSKSTSNNSFKADPHEISLPSPSMFYLPERRCDFSNVLVDLSENQNSRSTPDNLPPTHMYQSSTDSSLILATDGWHQGLVGDNIEAQGTFDGALKRIIEQQLLKNSPTRGNAVMAVNSRKRQREDSSSIEVSGDDKRLKKGSEGKEEEVEHLGKRICQNINYNGIDAPSPTDPSNARTRRSKFDRATELSTSFLRNCLADTSGIVNSRHHSARKRKNAPLTSGIDLDLSCLFAYSKPSGPEFTHMWEELVLHPLKSKSINNRSSHGEKRGENQQGALQSTAVIYPRDAPGDGGPAASNGNSGVPNSGSYSTTNANKPFSAKPRNDAHVESVRVATTLHAAVTNDKMFQSADLELERPRGAVPEKNLDAQASGAAVARRLTFDDMPNNEDGSLSEYRDGRSRASSIKSIISRDSGNASLPSLGNDGGYSASHHDDYMYEVDTQNLERVSIPDSKIVLDEEVYKHGSRHGSENLFSRGSLNKLLRELHHLRRKHAVEAELSQDMNDEPGYITTVRIKRQR